MESDPTRMCALLVGLPDVTIVGRLGTNRLEIRAGQNYTGESGALPSSAANRIRRLQAIDRAGSTTTLPVTVRRSDVIPSTNTGAITVAASDLELPAAIGARIAAGRWHDDASITLPTVVLGATAALAAKKVVDSTLTALLLGLAGVVLLVGGIGIANVMVMGVLERRTEIGVRRSLGATKGHIRVQFLLEVALQSRSARSPASLPPPAPARDAPLATRTRSLAVDPAGSLMSMAASSTPAEGSSDPVLSGSCRYES